MKLVARSSPKLCVVWVLLILVRGVLPAAMVYSVKEFVQAAELFYGRKTQGVVELLAPLAFLGGIYLAIEVLGSISKLVSELQADKLQDYVSQQVHETASNLDLSFFEDSEYYEHLHLAVYESRRRPAQLLGNLSSLIQHSVTLVSMGSILLPYSAWLPIALFVSTIPAFLSVVVYGIRRHRWRSRMNQTEREARYYNWLLTGPEAAPELRLFQLGDSFKRRFQQLRETLRNEKLRLVFSEMAMHLMASGVGLALAGAVAWWTLRHVSSLRESAPLAHLAFFYQAFSQGQKMMRSLLRQAGELYANSLYLGDLRTFLQLKTKITDPAQPKDSANVAPHIRFENVTYGYRDHEPVFSDFDLDVPAGSFVAIVGPNGAGKSTMMKLLCRLYDPTAGRITWDGVDLRDYAHEQLRRRTTVLFQDPVHYNASVKENIALSFAHDDDGKATSHIVQAAREAGVDEMIHRRFKDDYDQLLGYWFAEGTELSDGEWQKIGLARACYRESPFIILDEPTSAMDPWAEARWTERFRHFAKGRTVLLITHRFTTARHADKICVLANGSIAESGTHFDLINQDGLYARSWREQHVEYPAAG